MDNFTIIYKILSALDKAMDYPDFDISQIDANVLKVSEERWGRYMEMLVDNGFVKGVRVFKNICGETQVEDSGIRITLKGLEYLNDNTFLKRVIKVKNGIKEITPPKYSD